MTRDLDVVRTAGEWLSQGSPVALAAVVRTWGSAPRRAGSLLVATEGARFQGSVSGGCVEAAVVDRSMEMLEEAAADLLSFGVSNDDAWAVGLACGGQVDVHVSTILPNSPDSVIIFEIVESCERGRTPTLVINVGEPGLDLAYPLEPPELDPSALSGKLQALAKASVWEDRTVRETVEGQDRVLRPFNPPVRVVLIGAVHVAQTLAPMVRMAGFEVVVVDPRPAWLTPDRFPDSQTVAAWPTEALEQLRPDHRTAVVTLSHDPKLDDPALTAALASEAFYVGALGSKRTHSKRLARLSAEGVEGLDRVRAPVGLQVGAREPAEIAVSILAEILSVLRLGSAGD